MIAAIPRNISAIITEIIHDDTPSAIFPEKRNAPYDGVTEMNRPSTRQFSADRIAAVFPERLRKSSSIVTDRQE